MFVAVGLAAAVGGFLCLLDDVAVGSPSADLFLFLATLVWAGCGFSGTLSGWGGWVACSLLSGSVPLLVWIPSVAGCRVCGEVPSTLAVFPVGVGWGGWVS